MTRKCKRKDEKIISKVINIEDNQMISQNM